MKTFVRYPLESLNDESFQQLCQALLVKEYPSVQCFPVGQPDGGRDAIQRTVGSGSANKKFIVYQVKFVRDPNSFENPRKWLLDTIADELPKIKVLIDRSASAYVLLTNVYGSSHLDVGSIDKMHQLITETLGMSATCWWRDDIERRLDNAWDIKWAYPAVMAGSRTPSVRVRL